MNAYDFSWSPDGKAVVISCDDTNTLIWDVTDLVGTKEGQIPAPSAAQLAAAWENLRSDDAGTAYLAGWKLSESPAQAVPFLKARLKPVVAVERDLVTRLIADLDANIFAVRRKAYEQLRALGDQAEPELRKALDRELSAEVRRRVKILLTQPKNLPPEHLRQLRALHLLERIGTPESMRVLKDLAGGAPASRLTQEAKAALARKSLASLPPD